MRTYRYTTLPNAMKAMSEDEMVRRIGREMEKNGAVKVGHSERFGDWKTWNGFNLGFQYETWRSVNQ